MRLVGESVKLYMLVREDDKSLWNWDFYLRLIHVYVSIHNLMRLLRICNNDENIAKS